MAHNTKHNVQLERIMNFIADSEFGLSDEELLAEMREVGIDPIEEAEATSNNFREISQQLETLTTRWAMLGHRMRSTHVKPDGAETSITCVDCGLIVRLDVSTGKIVGSVLYTPCYSTRHYAAAKTGS